MEVADSFSQRVILQRRHPTTKAFLREADSPRVGNVGYADNYSLPLEGKVGCEATRMRWQVGNLCKVKADNFNRVKAYTLHLLSHLR